MGTQFWWFYDVLIIAVAAGLLYNAAAKGLNKMIFPLVLFIFPSIFVIVLLPALLNMMKNLVK